MRRTPPTVPALGSALALLVALVAAVLGFLWFPVARLLRKRKRISAAPEADTAQD